MAPPPPPPPSITPSLPPRSHLFTPIQEGNESEETEERHRFDSTSTPPTTTTPATSSCTDYTISHHHPPTPLHHPASKKPTRKPPPSTTSNDRTVSCNNCRPTTREKTSVMVVPLDHHNHSLSSTSPSSNKLLKSLFSSLSRWTPKPSPSPTTTSSVASTAAPPHSDVENWRITVAELSHKLVQATRRRDEAILEASKLKYSMSELEKKLTRLEVYCHNLKSGLDICNQAQVQAQSQSPITTPHRHNDLIVKNFLVAVSDARSSIRFLSKSLCSQLNLMGVKVVEKLSLLLLKSYDFKISGKGTHTLQYYLEALLSASFFDDFNSSGFMKNSTDHILNPIDKCEANYSGYTILKDLTWEEVLNKGTKHFSEEFSSFCDRKMSEIVGMLGWERAWPEQLLQAFFGASKSVWLVHLLANSVHPRIMIFRVEKGVRFDPIYMDDMGGDKAKKLIPIMVRVMVAPGFYVFDNVVKCKVISRYYNSNYGVLSGNNSSSNNSSV